MNFQQAAAAVTRCYQKRVPVLLSGPPGCAKSAVVKHVAESLGVDIVDRRASQTESIDWRGCMKIDDEKDATVWKIPDYLPRSGSGILFLDEMRDAPRSVQCALAQLILDRQLGDYRVPDGWYVMAASNRQEDRAGVDGRLSTALANRFVHLSMDVDVDGWLNWFWNQDDYPEEIGFFVGFRRECLFKFDPASRDLAFPTPRSWEMAAKLYDAALPAEILQPLIAGAVGQGAAAEFLAFCKIYKELPNLDSIIMDPERAVVPDEPSARAAVVSGLSKKASPASIGSILKYLSRLPKEYEFLGMKLSRRFAPSIEQTKDAARWMSANSRFLMAA